MFGLVAIEGLDSEQLDMFGRACQAAFGAFMVFMMAVAVGLQAYMIFAVVKIISGTGTATPAPQVSKAAKKAPATTPERKTAKKKAASPKATESATPRRRRDPSPVGVSTRAQRAQRRAARD